MLLADSGGCACFLVSQLEAAADGGAGVAELVDIEDARGAHDEGRPTEKLVRANACRSCTSHSTLQARWHKRGYYYTPYTLEWSESL